MTSTPHDAGFPLPHIYLRLQASNTDCGTRPQKPGVGRLTASAALPGPLVATIPPHPTYPVYLPPRQHQQATLPPMDPLGRSACVGSPEPPAPSLRLPLACL